MLSISHRWPHQRNKCAQVMGSQSCFGLTKRPSPIRFRPNHSPLEKTPHKARNGELTITCRNRHCPRCQTSARDRWLAERTKELLPVAYSHVVFTIPHQLAALAQQNKRVLYDLLLRTSAATLLEIAADPGHLGAKIGFLSVLHTWGQNLKHHPHVHCVVPTGGLAFDESSWILSAGRFLSSREGAQ